MRRSLVLRWLLAVALAGAAVVGFWQWRQPPSVLPAELTPLTRWLRALPPDQAQKWPGAVLALTASGALAAQEGGHPSFAGSLHPRPRWGEDLARLRAAETWLLAATPQSLQTALVDHHLDYVITGEPDLRDAQFLPLDPSRADALPLALSRSELRHLQTLYGTATKDRPCVDQLQLVAASDVIRDVGGRHLPAALLYRRVPGARIQLHNRVPGVPLRVVTTRRIGDRVFTFVCDGRVDANGTGEVRFPYPSTPTGSIGVDGTIMLWTALQKAGEPLEISAEAVERGESVND